MRISNHAIMLHTCASISVDVSSWSVAVQGRHFDVVGSVWVQVLQDDAVLVSWHGRLQEHNKHEGLTADKSLSGIWWGRAHAYEFLNGVPCGGGVGDAVLYDWTVSVVPVHSQGAGRGVVHTEVPWATAGH